VKPKKQSHSRYLQAVNKAHLAALAAGVLVVLPACGGGDKETFGSTEGATETTISAETIASVGESSIPVTTLASESTAITAAAGPAVPASTEMTVSFTYTANSTGGRVRNPYIAVWVEDKDGNLVQTISVWFLQSTKGKRWLNDLRSWYSVATQAGAEVTTSGATRPAGSYSVAWDGKGMDGKPVPQGEYVLYVESAREKGPYSITSTPITLGTEGVAVTLPDNGELNTLSATVTV